MSFNIIEKNKEPFLNLYLNHHFDINNPEYQAHICQYDILNSTLTVLNSSNDLEHCKKDLKGLQYMTFEVINRIINHNNYTIKLEHQEDEPKIIITHKASGNSIEINDPAPFMVLASPKRQSKHILIGTVPCDRTKAGIFLVDNTTGKIIKQIFNLPFYFIRQNVSQSPFSKHDHFIMLMTNNDLYLYNLENLEIAFHKKLNAEISPAIGCLAPLLINDEKIILVANNNQDQDYIYCYRNPLYERGQEIKRQEEKYEENLQDQKERRDFLKEIYSDFKINFIDGQKLDATKLLLLFGK